MGGLFRSIGYEKGATRRLGSVHFHVDCSQSALAEHALVELAVALEQRGWLTKVTRVSVARAGADFTDPKYSDDYLEHTPELCEGKNSFAAYLTALLAPNPISSAQLSLICEQARSVLGQLLKDFEASSVVVEIERVAAVIDIHTAAIADPVTFDMPSKYRKSRFEIHHFVDLPLTASVNFDEWTELCAAKQIVVGGWFQFDKASESAFRSVRFVEELDIVKLIEDTRVINRIARECSGNMDVAVETIVEQIMELWRV